MPGSSIDSAQQLLQHLVDRRGVPDQRAVGVGALEVARLQVLAARFDPRARLAEAAEAVRGRRGEATAAHRFNYIQLSFLLSSRGALASPIHKKNFLPKKKGSMNGCASLAVFCLAFLAVPRSPSPRSTSAAPSGRLHLDSDFAEQVSSAHPGDVVPPANIHAEMTRRTGGASSADSASRRCSRSRWTTSISARSRRVHHVR
jgi:hypothetical protein